MRVHVSYLQSSALPQVVIRYHGTYVTILQDNLQLLMVEIFKTRNDLIPTFMKNIFTERDVRYSLRSKNHLQWPNVRTAEYGIENVNYIGHSL